MALATLVLLLVDAGASIKHGITPTERKKFLADGFVVLDDAVLSASDCTALRDCFDDLFAGRFDTKIFPDEWHWRKGISMPSAVREMVNAWKCSDLVARVALHARLGRLACQLTGWEAARLAQDEVVDKPPGAGGVGYHRDSAYISDNFVPRDSNSVTMWIALDDADVDNGVVEYAVGSHMWSRDCAGEAQFHGTTDYMAAVRAAAPDDKLHIVAPRIPTGRAVVHHQDVLHGSPPNISPHRPRRALVLHFLRADVQFRSTPPPDYIYGRYVLDDDPSVHDSFFPVVYDGRISDIDLPHGPTARRRLMRCLEQSATPNTDNIAQT